MSDIVPGTDGIPIPAPQPPPVEPPSSDGVVKRSARWLLNSTAANLQGAWRFAKPVLVRCLKALFEWSAHAAMMYGFLFVFELSRHAIIPDPKNPPTLFDGLLPVAWVFDAADLAVMLGVTYFGVKAAIKAYRGH